MRYTIKNLFLNIVSFFNIGRKISLTEANAYFDKLAASGDSCLTQDCKDLS